MAGRFEEYKVPMTMSPEGAEPVPGPAAQPIEPQVGAAEADDPLSSPMPQAAAPQQGQYWQQAPMPPQFAPQPYPPYQGYPGYQGHPGYPPMMQRPGTNAFAIAGFVCGFVFNILGIIFGFVALNQIKRTGEQGRGLAIAGIWVGAASVALTVVWFVVFFSIFVNAMHQLPPPGP